MNSGSRYSQLALAVAASLVSASGFAQDDLDETVVTATRTPVPLDAVGAPVIVITRSDIERSLASDVSELLQTPCRPRDRAQWRPGANHLAVHARHRKQPHRGAHRRRAHQSRHHRRRGAAEHRARIARAHRDRQGPALFAVRHRCHRRRGAAVHARRGERRRQRRRHVRQRFNTQQVFGDAALSAGEQFKFGFGGSYAESDGMPTFVDDDTDRGYRNVTGARFAEFAATDALTFRARGWQATGRTEYSAQTFSDPPYAARVAGFREQRVFGRRRIPRRRRSRRARHGEPARSTTSNSCRPASAPRNSTMHARSAPTSTCRSTWRRSARTRSASACSAATKTRARNPSARCSTKTRW